ncbi:AAA domain (dynein-related subfamily) [Maioricimonas rarisocia]|uniref:AAA domain (Dynein-related subfamily) n=1 Tax=Maioricimonas rarisocia TaxID=2528026 RepID=A0A517ZE80_9PLAN|nr:AAA family ATPase [Maioricimonas rarisocia]QDU40787.1 AAA domain (dynein-related subfamily) [Maioricimonas rarisocia]
MLQQQFGFRREPFDSRGTGEDYISSPLHDEAVARIEYLVECRRRCGILIGPRGSGKTTLLDRAARRIARSPSECCLISLTSLTTDELLWHLAAGMGRNPRVAASRLERWQLVSDALEGLAATHTHLAILLDGFERADLSLLPTVSRLIDLASGSPVGQTFIIATRPHLPGPLYDWLIETAELRVELDLLSESETAAYVQASLKQAGRREPLFDEDALRTIHQLTEGRPSEINRLCQLALIAAAAEERSRVDDGILRDIAQELPGDVGTRMAPLVG